MHEQNTDTDLWTKTILISRIELNSTSGDLPPFSSDLTPVPDLLPVDSYVKRPSLVTYSENDNFRFNDLLNTVARLCEVLRKHPHINIAKYFCCTIDGD